MKIAKNPFILAIGLMFAGKKRINRGLCLKLPVQKDVIFGASVTMLFCFYSMDIIFINSKNKVVEKVCLKPWVLTYTPKNPSIMIIESSKGKFKDLKVGDIIKIKE